MMSDDKNILELVNSYDDSDLDDEEQRTVFCANFTSEVTEELLYELFLQAGPIDKIQIPKESDGKRNKSYAFIIYEHKCTVPYALKLYEGVKLFNRPLDIKLRKRNTNNNDNNQQQNNDKNILDYRMQNNTQALYSTNTEPIINPISNSYPLNMILLNQRYNNPGYNNFNPGLMNSNVGFDNFNLGFNSLNQFNHFNPDLARFYQELINLNPGLY